MSKIPDFVQGMAMPAMQKKNIAAIDIMRPGNGTPWEDRGSGGAVGAYIKTVIKSMFSPVLLFDHIRRPETTTDSNSFAVTSAVMWIIGIVIYNIYWLKFVLPTSTEYEAEIDPMYYWLTVLIQALLVGGGIFLWLKIGPKLFGALGATELKNVQPSLVSNCFNYSMGPSILALIPIYGWAAAYLWIIVDVMIASKRRLYMKANSSIINVIILAVIVAAGVGIGFVLLHYVWGGKWFEMNGLTHKVEAPPSRLPNGMPAPRGG